MATWEAQFSASEFVIFNGGRAGAIWVYLGAFIGFLTAIASMAEMASMAPTTGGQYRTFLRFHLVVASTVHTRPRDHIRCFNLVNICFRLGLGIWTCIRSETTLVHRRMALFTWMASRQHCNRLLVWYYPAGHGCIEQPFVRAHPLAGGPHHLGSFDVFARLQHIPGRAAASSRGRCTSDPCLWVLRHPDCALGTCRYRPGKRGVYLVLQRRWLAKSRRSLSCRNSFSGLFFCGTGCRDLHGRRASRCLAQLAESNDMDCPRQRRNGLRDDRHFYDDAWRSGGCTRLTYGIPVHRCKLGS